MQPELNDKIICYKFASRSRPEKFFSAVNNIMNFSLHRNYFIVCSFDEDDATMNNDAVKFELAILCSSSGNRVIYKFGKSKNKIDAINRDMEGLPHYDVLINMSDDMRFMVSGFDKIILRDLFTAFPDGDGVVAYYDQGKDTKGTGLMTMSIMGKKYYDRFGYIYFPGYISLWSDNEATKVAQLLNRYHFSEENIISHDHPANGIGEMDAQYRATEDAHIFHKDKKLFEDREAKSFFLSEKLLSILICTMPERKEMLEKLLTNLNAQLQSLYFNSSRPDIPTYIEILTSDSGESIGQKRQQLLDLATGLFIVFIDDDDNVDDLYLRYIYTAIERNKTVDCIGIKGWITTDGENKKDWEISKDFDGWYEKDNVYYRTPNHISPVRRELACIAGFPDKNFGEDYDYSMALLPYLKKESKIDKQIYHYDYRTKK